MLFNNILAGHNASTSGHPIMIGRNQYISRKILAPSGCAGVRVLGDFCAIWGFRWTVGGSGRKNEGGEIEPVFLRPIGSENYIGDRLGVLSKNSKNQRDEEGYEREFKWEKEAENGNKHRAYARCGQ